RLRSVTVVRGVTVPRRWRWTGRSPRCAAATATGTRKLPIPAAPPRPLPDVAGREGSAASLVIREPRKYQMPTTMPAMTTTQSHQRLFEGLAGDASVAEWLPGSRRSIDLSCPIHSLLTD